ncbi:hypothetical protein PIIN_05524 [Serendipita indica DSM 11827]|uniref:MINDY deubiquitinase domain-containing protein n=1 Tax=Serendipita indica (strain DSM 11827) TaxID=1109443 RepID=G4TJV3_SERID|nr:hypothetical protein PIIN_05524 [Serendipita indica DSM 11827]
MTEVHAVASGSKSAPYEPVNGYEVEHDEVAPASASTAPEKGTASRTSSNGKHPPSERSRNEQMRQPEKIESPEWGLKEILWPPEPWDGQPQRRVRIVTQNTNGPCSFIAICNILIMRGAITIRPRDRRSASYEYLAGLVGDYLVNNVMDVDLDAVFSVLPKTQEGMDLNPLFTSISSFRPAGKGGELKLFDLAGIKLVHGWIADPQSSEFAALSKAEDYDTCMDLIVAADAAMGGKLMVEDNEAMLVEDSAAKPAQLSEEEHQKVVDALQIRHWLDSNPTQMTYHGLFALNESQYIEPNELVCFFRGSHLSVLYKRKEPGTESTMLYTLVTDRVFLKETDVVWESLVDVDGHSSAFYDENFRKANPVGGDFAGHTSEQIARQYERMHSDPEVEADARLAWKLQRAEQEYAR